jgi:hypothetical protein
MGPIDCAANSNVICLMAGKLLATANQDIIASIA